MKNFQLELEAQLEDKKYIQIKSGKQSYLEIEDKAKPNKIKYKEVNSEIKNRTKCDLKDMDETKKLNEEKSYLQKIRDVSLKKENKDIIKKGEKSHLEIEVKFLLEKKEKIYLEKAENFKLKLNKEFQINNIKNSSNINDKSELIAEKNNIIKRKNYIINQILFFFIFSLYTSCFKTEKRREEIIPGEAPRIKISKDKNGFFEDKNKLG